MSNEVPLQVRTRSALTRIKATGAAVVLIAMSAIPAAAATAIASVRPAAGIPEATFQAIQ